MPLGLFFDKWYLPYIAINISNLLPDYCGFFKDMHEILNEEFAMLPEINIQLEFCGFCGKSMVTNVRFALYMHCRP